MAQATRKRQTRGRIQPYAWLGAGAVTLGMGAAMVGGTAVAFADTGNDASGSSSSSGAGNESAKSTSTKSDAPRRGARSARGGAHNDSAASAADAPDSSSSTPTRAGRVSASVVVRDSTPTFTETATPVADPTPAGAGDAQPAAAAAEANKAEASVSAPAAAVAPASATTAAVVSEVSVDPAPNMDSWLPTTQIVPGKHVQMAVDQITDAQALLKEETWGSGNVLAGLGSFGPQAALATAQALLGLWSSTIASAQKAVADSVGNPLMHGIAQARLQNELTYTKLAGISLQTAYSLMTPLGWFGADIAPVQDLVADAKENGKVYAKVKVRMVAGTQPVVDVKINGGRNTALLVDTGASGLVTTADKVPAQGLGAKTGEGNSCFSGGLCYHYDTYNTTIDLGDGAVGVAPVNIVTDNAEYPNSVKNFKQFFAWGADGILGIGANTEGPGPVPIPTAAMPGELSDGVLIHEKATAFGGYLILGPNLYPTRVSLPGAPDAWVNVSLDGAPQQLSGAIIDSGGVYGTILRKDIPSSITPVTIDGVEYLPAGVKISVYAPDGKTLLYTYTTIRGGTPVIDTGLFNTGNAPHALGPIYLNYGATPYGIGSTDFSIY